MSANSIPKDDLGEREADVTTFGRISDDGSIPGVGSLAAFLRAGMPFSRAARPVTTAAFSCGVACPFGLFCESVRGFGGVAGHGFWNLSQMYPEWETACPLCEDAQEDAGSTVPPPG